MYSAPNPDTMEGRQLAGLLASKNRSARMMLTVDITKADGSTYHQTFRAKAWNGNNGQRMLSLDLNDGDWATGTPNTKVLHVDTTAGVLRPARGMGDKRMVYAATAAVRWAFGNPVVPSNGTVAVSAAKLCGACGTELTHETSKTLGIGPECAKRLGLAHHYSSSKTLTGEARKDARKRAAAEAAPAAPAQEELPVLPTGYGMNETVGRTDIDIFGAPMAADGGLATSPAHDAEEVAVHQAALRQAEADMQRAIYRRDAALRAGRYDEAQQYEDQVDTFRGMATKFRAEMVGNGMPLHPVAA